MKPKEGKPKKKSKGGKIKHLKRPGGPQRSKREGHEAANFRKRKDMA